MKITDTEQMEFKDKIKLLGSPDFHESIGILPKWRIGDKLGDKNEIYPYYDADQCEEILDEVLGIDGWGKEYREVAGYLFCSIQIFGSPNGMVEKSDAGGARQTRKKLEGEDGETWNAKTAATSSFVRAASVWGIGRHLAILPKIRLQVQQGVCITDNGERLPDPETLSAWCNKTSPAVKHLAAVYLLHRSGFDGNDRAKQMLSELRTFIEGGK